MGNIFCCCIGRRRRSNVSPKTETTPLQPHPPEIPVHQSVSASATSYPNLCRYSNPYPHQYPSYFPSPPGTMSEPYDHQPHPWTAGRIFPRTPLPPAVDEKAVTVRNDTNLRKETLSLEPDPVNPGRVLVAFTFDARVSGGITVVLFAKDVEQFQLTAAKEDTLPPITFDFEKGIGQKFVQPSGAGVDLSFFEDSELFKEAGTDIFPLAIKTEAVPEEGKSGSMNMQITQVTYVKEKGEIKPSVIKQLLSVNGPGMS